MNTGGYVKLHRRLLDHPLMTELPAAWFRVWIAILLRANWQAGKWWSGTEDITIQPGSLVTSIEKLSRLAGVSTRQSRGTLEYLQKTGAVTIQATSRYSIITICNWEAYQKSEDEDDKPRDKPDDKVTTSGTSVSRQQYKNQEVIRGLRTDVRSLTFDDAANTKLLKRTIADAFGGKQPPQTVTRKVIEILKQHGISIDRYCEHLLTLPDAERTAWGWSYAVAHDLGGCCLHGNPKDGCRACYTCEHGHCDLDGGDCPQCDTELRARHQGAA